MRWSWFILLLTSFSSPNGFGQERSEGTYGSAGDWRTGTAMDAFSPQLVKVKNKAQGYSVYSFRDPRGQGFLMVWGMHYRDTLYLRDRGNLFIRALEQGTLCHFKGPPVPLPPSEPARVGSFMTIGDISPLSAADGPSTKGSTDYVLDTRKDRLYTVSPGRMRILLANHPGLLAAFEREPQPPSIEVMLDFVRRLNAEDLGD